MEKALSFGSYFLGIDALSILLIELCPECGINSIDGIQVTALRKGCTIVVQSVEAVAIINIAYQAVFVSTLDALRLVA
ncbi:MAG: hypothetical protein AAGJ93_02010 [Bacteroidota bacterium]